MSEKDEADTLLTAFEAGNFVTVDRPAWWEQELDRLYMSDTVPKPHLSFGAGADMGVFVFALGQKRGFYVEFWNSISSEDVWCRVSAYLMNLLTTRVRGWLALSGKHALSDQVEDFRDALVSCVRRGQGGHVHEAGGIGGAGHQRAHRRRKPATGAVEADIA